MKKILVLTDLSDNSVNAYRYAVELACGQQSDIVLVFSSNGAEISLTGHHLFSLQLQSFAKRYSCLTRARTSPHHIECLISNDKWAHALSLLVPVHQPDLVIAGTGILDTICQEQGTWCLKPLQQCPVLWVPDKAVYRPLKEMVYVTDFTDQDPAVLDQIKTFAAQFQAAVTPVHFYPGADGRTVAELQQDGQELHWQLGAGSGQPFLMEEEDLMEGLQEMAEKQPVDLFIVAATDSHLVQQYIEPAYKKTQACQTETPVLNFFQEKTKRCAGTCAYCQQHNSPPQVALEE